jgi:hypothetical protein
MKRVATKADVANRRPHPAHPFACAGQFGIVGP